MRKQERCYLMTKAVRRKANITGSKSDAHQMEEWMDHNSKSKSEKSQAGRILTSFSFACNKIPSLPLKHASELAQYGFFNAISSFLHQ